MCFPRMAFSAFLKKTTEKCGLISFFFVWTLWVKTRCLHETISTENVFSMFFLWIFVSVWFGSNVICICVCAERKSAIVKWHSKIPVFTINFCYEYARPHFFLILIDYNWRNHQRKSDFFLNPFHRLIWFCYIWK